MHLPRYAVAGVLCVLSLAGCGGPTQGTAAALQDRVNDVVAAAEAGDGAAARSALDALRVDVAAAQRLEAITAERAAQVLAAADAVAAGLPSPAPPSEQPAAEVPEPEPGRPSESDEKGDEQRDDKGKDDDKDAD